MNQTVLPMQAHSDEPELKVETVGDTEKVEKEVQENDEKPKVQYFQCSSCFLREKYEYFGKSPPFVKDYKLEEEAYLIEDPFLPPKRGELLIIGAHCVKCKRTICKDSNCSFYFGGTYCVKCAKECMEQFPKPVQEKLNRIVIPT